MIKPSKIVFGKLWQSFKIFFSNFGIFFSISIFFGIISIILNVLFFYLPSTWTIGITLSLLKQILQFIVYILWILVTSKVIIDIINWNELSVLDSIKEIFKNALKYLTITFTFWIRAYKIVLLLLILYVWISGYLFITDKGVIYPSWTISTILMLIAWFLIIALIYVFIVYFAWSYIIFDKKITKWKELENIAKKIGWKRRWRTLSDFIVIWIILYVLFISILGFIYAIFSYNNITISWFEKFWFTLILWLIIIEIMWYTAWEIVVIYAWLLYKQYDEEEFKLESMSSSKDKQEETTKEKE